MTFLDTNIFVYAVDPRDSVKHEKAKAIIKAARYSEEYVVSAQVLNEFSSVALRKLRLTPEETSRFVRLFGAIKTISISPTWTVRALDMMSRFSLQFYDSLILSAAEAMGCDTLLTEDLNDGQVYCGIHVINPFKS